MLLVVPQPWLLRVSQHAAAEEVSDETEDDEDKGDGVEVVNREAKDVDANDDTPKVGGEEGDVEEGGATHAKNEGREAVEEVETDGIADHPADKLRVPVCGGNGLPVKDGGLDAVDDAAKEAEERENVVNGSLGDEILLKDVADAVETGSEKSEEVSLEEVDTRTAVGAGDVVGSEKHAHTAAADEDSDDLEELVTDAEKGEGEDDDADNGPEVDELCGENVGVAVRQHGEVVAFDIQEAHYDVLPAIRYNDTEPSPRSLANPKHNGVNDEEQDIVKEGLEGGYVGTVGGEQGSESVRGRDAEREDLADEEDDPEVDGGEVGVPLSRGGLEGANAFRDDGGGRLVGTGVGRWGYEARVGIVVLEP